MPQNPLSAYIARAFGGTALLPLQVDANGLLLESGGGGSSRTLNLTAAAVIKATPGRLALFTILNAGTTSGTFTFNDCATVGAATTANQIFTIAYNASNCFAGALFIPCIVCTTGIVLSAVPGGGTPQLTVCWS
jgi:hypothetical protein